MRCFICIDLPKEVQNEMARIQSELPKDSKLIIVKPKDIHLTLKFLGDIDEDKIEKVKDLLKKINFQKFKAKVNGSGFFPTPSFIRVVWAGIEPKQEFEKIHEIIEKLLSLEDFKPDKGWQNHATLARVKWIRDKNEFVDKIKQIKLKPIEFIIDNIKFKKSTLTPEGPVYEDLLNLKFS